MSKTEAELLHSTIIYTYDCGVVDIIHSTSGFMEAGWERSDKWENLPEPGKREKGKIAEGADMERSMRRARANLRRLALANDFRWFVTLTLDQTKIDRNDGKAVAHALGRWADNMVRRKGLKYVLVPELHEKGGIHFHGFFNDAVQIVDSGTIKLPGVKKPRRPKDAEQREEWLAAGGMVVYNLPEWPLGFTTAIELYGEYPAAVGYVTKYIGKQGVRPMGRWYYSGGALKHPKKTYADLDKESVEECGNAVEFSIPGGKITVCHTKMEV